MKPLVHSVHIVKKRRRAKRLHWSIRNRYRRRAIIPEIFRLPTRNTLTYAEAQRFVHVYVNGSVSRLNILEPLSVIDESDVKKYCDDSGDCIPLLLPAGNNAEVVPSRLCRAAVVSSQQGCKSSTCTAVTSVQPEPAAYYRHVEKTPEELNDEVEYDTDEQVFISVFLGGGVFVACLVLWTFKALSTLSQKSVTVTENGETTAKFGDCRTFWRQSHFSVALFCDIVDRL